MNLRGSAVAVLAALLIGTPAHSEPVYRVGLIQQVEHPSLDEIRTAILEELENLGYGPDKVAIDYQNGQNNPAIINTICQKFLGDGVDLILPIATSAAQGAAAATQEIPIVFAAVSDPIAAGMVVDPDHPDRNVTGISNAIDPEGVLELAQELTPGIETYGLVYNTSEVNSVSTVNKAKAAMERRGLKWQEAVITGSHEVSTAVTSLLDRVDAFFISNDNTVAVAMTLLSQIAIEAKLPVYVAVDSLVADGGLATTGISYTDLGHRAARMAVRILEGAAIADTPVEIISGGVVAVNAETAAALGVDVSAYLP